MTQQMPDGFGRQCPDCHEVLDTESPEAIEHFRLFHPDRHEAIKRLTDAYLEHQFQQLKPEDFS